MSCSKPIQQHQPCYEKRHKFCFNCGQFKPSSKLKAISDAVVSDYKLCYQIQIPDFRRSFIPNRICTSCKSNLSKVANGFRELTAKSSEIDRIRIQNSLFFITPSIWKKPKNSASNSHANCFICLTNISDNLKLRHESSISYPSDSSKIEPVPNVKIRIEDGESEKEESDEDDEEGLCLDGLN